MRSEKIDSGNGQEIRTGGIGSLFDMAGAKQIGDALSIYWNDFDADRFVLALFSGHDAEGRKRKKVYPIVKPKGRGKIYYDGMK